MCINCFGISHVGKYSELYHRLEWTGTSYRYQGCFLDTTGPFLGRTLPQGLDGRKGVGVDDCAAAARSRGFPLFALQGYGQCFFGSMADVQRSQQKLADGDCNDLPCPASAATCRGYVNKVYILIGTYPSGTPCTLELPIYSRCHLCDACAWDRALSSRDPLVSPTTVAEAVTLPDITLSMSIVCRYT
jgi:hypothetical protein